ncbi:MAG TPA: hypothetical protein VHI10_01865, partial [Mycobacterium sp.]|nr:hypothetical protein [Mycobacterium sp.]
MATTVLGSNPVGVDNTLAFMDQASYLWVRASGHVHAIQCTWVYRRDIDLEGLGRTRDNLADGLLGRRIERSPIPFGRHRWVRCHEPPGIDISAPAPISATLTGWLDERAQIPVDPEFGPCWHLGVLPIENYGTAVSLVASHTVIDAVGLCLALRDAANGVRHDFGYPPAHARSRRRALAEDARQIARDLPDVVRAVGAAAKLAVTHRPTGAPPTSAAPDHDG